MAWQRYAYRAHMSPGEPPKLSQLSYPTPERPRIPEIGPCCAYAGGFKASQPKSILGARLHRRIDDIATIRGKPSVPLNHALQREKVPDVPREGGRNLGGRYV